MVFDITIHELTDNIHDILSVERAFQTFANFVGGNEANVCRGRAPPPLQQARHRQLPVPWYMFICKIYKYFSSNITIIMRQLPSNTFFQNDRFCMQDIRLKFTSTSDVLYKGCFHTYVFIFLMQSLYSMYRISFT